MKVKTKGILKIIILMIVFVIVQSCINVETEMEINSDLSGTSVSKLSIARNILPEEEFKKEVEKLGIKNFEIQKETETDGTSDVYTVKMEWKDEEELKKIMSFINTGVTISEYGASLNPLNSKKQAKDTKDNTVENSGAKDGQINGNGKENENVVNIEKKGEDSKEVEKPLNSIFSKENNVITVDMGTVKINKIIIKVKGKIIPESVHSGIVSASKNEITFYEGDKVNFKYKNNDFLLPALIGLGISLLIGLTAILFFKINKRKERDAEDELERDESENQPTESGEDKEENTSTDFQEENESIGEVAKAEEALKETDKNLEAAISENEGLGEDIGNNGDIEIENDSLDRR